MVELNEKSLAFLSTLPHDPENILPLHQRALPSNDDCIISVEYHLVVFGKEPAFLVECIKHLSLMLRAIYLLHDFLELFYLGIPSLNCGP
jgi:hypothetical protein